VNGVRVRGVAVARSAAYPSFDTSSPGRIA
jgi:hypothetical protein